MPIRTLVRRLALGAALVLTFAAPPPAVHADGQAEAKRYRPDFDYPGRGDDWYGRFLPDPRRDFPAATTAVERASDGDDFGRGYRPLAARDGFGPPLARTNLSGSAYRFHDDPIASGVPTSDCDANGIDDACDLDCGAAGGPCDVPGCGTASDCDGNAVPDVCQLGGDDCDGDGRLDTCQLAEAAAGCSFGVVLAENGTTGDDAIYLGAPDDTYWGLGGQQVTWELTCGAVADGPGPDITLYEVDTGSPEFQSVDLLVSADGAVFVSLEATESGPVSIPGDEAHGNPSYARSYDLAGSGLATVRFVRAEGAGSGGSGSSSGFDLDAIGFVNTISADCDATGTLDVCESAQDCNANGIPEACEVAFGVVDDCDSSGTPDTCDTLGGANDCDGDAVPDSCEPDCNANGTPDDCDIAAATSGDCNANAIPDECDLATTAVALEGTFPNNVGDDFQPFFTVSAPFPAAGDVAVSMTAQSDLEASNEYLDVTVEGAALARLFETAGAVCDAAAADTATIAAADFNVATGIAGPTGVAEIGILAPGTVNAFQCASTEATLSLTYTPIVDCNVNGTLDACEIAAATSFDVNVNNVADECEPDCNANGTPDDYDLAQGTSPDCNVNGIPDECDTSAGGASDDCNTDGIPDECQVDCNANGVPDDCDIAAATSNDCDLNAVPDECDLAASGPDGCAFPRLLADNGTGGTDETFLGAPDGVYYGLGGQVVTYEFDCGFVIDGPGPDFNIYEVGGAEFDSLDDVLVSGDGVNFVSVIATQGPGVRIPGDEVTSDGLIRSYDLFGTGMTAARFVRIDGAGTGASGPGTLFDLDAIGAIQRASNDCDGSGTLDACETFEDCNANGLNDTCELDLVITDDCNANGDLDACDILDGAPDVDFDWIPDECEPDCDGNAVPDHYDIEQGTSTDCNDNGIPDGCDLDQGGVPDCNADGLPDDCPVCPTVEVVFIMDTSSSMSGEGTALCAELQDVVAELQADLVDVDVELLGLLETGSSNFSCLTDTVANLYGTAVPGSPPAGQETLGEPCGVNLNEDWGPATSIVAGLKPWQSDSVRLIVPLSDEGPRCGNPVSDPGEDRLAINHAIGQARLNDVIVSPVAGSGSGAALIAIMDVIADATGGGTFVSTDPELDLSSGLLDLLESACFSRTDCNANGVPDDCDLAASTSQDCDGSGRPDECENDCNANGLEDSCDIADMTSTDDNANAVPDECEGLFLSSTDTEWTWTAVPGAIGYDVIRGDFGVLRATDGDFLQSTDTCLVDDTTGTTLPHAAPDPAPGEGQWVLVRGVIGGVDLTYDAFGTGLVESRDVEIEGSGLACP